MIDSKVPASLLQLQKWFAEILTRPLSDLGEYRIPIYDSESRLDIENQITASPHLTPSQRIGIYNQQFWFRLFILMQEHYPTLTALFGFDDFNRLVVEPYIVKYLPSHWFLPYLGESLPQWVQESYDQEDKSLVLQIALIDAAHERVFYRRSLSALTDFSEDLVIYLQPSVTFIELSADFFAFRKKLSDHPPGYWMDHDFPSIHWFEENIFYVLSRERDSFFHEKITLAQKILLEAFQEGSTLSQACALLKGELEEESRVKIKDWFQTWASRGWFTNCLGNL